MTTDDDNEPLRDDVATDPPPDGEQDPYGAPTRVAEVPENLLDDLRGRYMATANANANANAAKASPANANTDDMAALAAAAAHTVKPPRPAPPRAGPPPAQRPAAKPPLPIPHDDLDARDVPIQSGRTVPLTAALLADVIRSVDEKRAGGAHAPLAALAHAPPAAGVPAPPRRSALALAFILLLGFGIFVVGVAMFLDALR
jgi:hypothetical protein